LFVFDHVERLSNNHFTPETRTGLLTLTNPLLSFP